MVFIFIYNTYIQSAADPVGTGSGAICDDRLALLYAGCLFLPAAIAAWWMPEPAAEVTAPDAPNAPAETLTAFD